MGNKVEAGVEAAEVDVAIPGRAGKGVRTRPSRAQRPQCFDSGGPLGPDSGRPSRAVASERIGRCQPVASGHSGSWWTWSHPFLRHCRNARRLER